jgi:hypothetical protein
LAAATEAVPPSPQITLGNTGFAALGLAEEDTELPASELEVPQHQGGAQAATALPSTTPLPAPVLDDSPLIMEFQNPNNVGAVGARAGGGDFWPKQVVCCDDVAVGVPVLELVLR